MVKTRSQKRKGMSRRATRKNLKNRHVQTKRRGQQKGGSGKTTIMPVEHITVSREEVLGNGKPKPNNTTDVIDFKKRFKHLSCYLSKLSYKESYKNTSKNRYTNILANDSTRVILGDSGYINANYISLPISSREYDVKNQRQKKPQFDYIATQGPMKNTVPDFWQMVVENDVNCIVMVTGLVEQGNTKCADYFGENEEVNTIFKHHNITLTGKQDNDVYEERTFTYKDKNKKTKTVTHLWFRAWPDHGVPELNNFIKLLERFNKLKNERQGNFNPLVHCSAGVGRTGTFIVLDHILYDKKGNPITDLDSYKKDDDIYTLMDNTICQLRQQRNEVMVQTGSQYKFIYDVIEEEKEDDLPSPPRPTTKKPSSSSLKSNPVYAVPNKSERAQSGTIINRNRGISSEAEVEEEDDLPPPPEETINSPVKITMGQMKDITQTVKGEVKPVRPGDFAYQILKLFYCNETICDYSISYESSSSHGLFKIMCIPGSLINCNFKKKPITYKMLEDKLKEIYAEDNYTQITVPESLIVEVIKDGFVPEVYKKPHLYHWVNDALKTQQSSKQPSSQAGGRKSKSNPKTRTQKRRSTNAKNKRTRKSKK